MADIDWKHLPITLPGGGMLPHLSGRMRTATVDAVFQMTGGAERLANWANKPENYGDFITKVWAKGMSKPISVETTSEDSMEGLLARLDAGEHAKVISPDGQAPEKAEDFSADGLILDLDAE